MSNISGRGLPSIAPGGSPHPLLLPFQGKRPRIHPEAFLAPTAVVVGDVMVGPRSSIWYGVVVRADQQAVTIGEGTNLQDNAVVHVHPDHPTILKDGITVGHGAIIHGCLVENGCLIGMGAVLLSGCEVGRESLVAAGAVVKEGERIPARSLVAGVPAKVIRPLTPEDVQRMRENTLQYVRLARQHRKASVLS